MVSACKMSRIFKQFAVWFMRFVGFQKYYITIESFSFFFYYICIFFRFYLLHYNLSITNYL